MTAFSTPGVAASAPRFQDAVRDRELIGRIVQGDEEAFQELVGIYGPAAKGLACRIVRNPSIAEEALQEAFLSVWRAPGGYRADRGSVRAWMMATVHHRAVDSVRRESSIRRRADEAGELHFQVHEPDFSQSVVDDLERPQERAEIHRALGALPTEQRTVIEMMYFGAKTQVHIAEELGIPLGTIKSRCLLGMRRLRKALITRE